MKYWLMKSEPDAFGINDLEKAGIAPWDGVRNYQARNMMRDEMQPGDRIFFYHSSCPAPGIVGLMTVANAAYPDHTSWDPESKYYDPKSHPETPRWYMVDVAYERHLKRNISLAELKAHPPLAGMLLLKKGSRLSIVPLSQHEFDTILALE